MKRSGCRRAALSGDASAQRTDRELLFQVEHPDVGDPLGRLDDLAQRLGLGRLDRLGLGPIGRCLRLASLGRSTVCLDQPAQRRVDAPSELDAVAELASDASIVFDFPGAGTMSWIAAWADVPRPCDDVEMASRSDAARDEGRGGSRRFSTAVQSALRMPGTSRGWRAELKSRFRDLVRFRLARAGFASRDLWDGPA